MGRKGYLSLEQEDDDDHVRELDYDLSLQQKINPSHSVHIFQNGFKRMIQFIVIAMLIVVVLAYANMNKHSREEADSLLTVSPSSIWLPMELPPSVRKSLNKVDDVNNSPSLVSISEDGNILAVKTPSQQLSLMIADEKTNSYQILVDSFDVVTEKTNPNNKIYAISISGDGLTLAAAVSSTNESATDSIAVFQANDGVTSWKNGYSRLPNMDETHITPSIISGLALSENGRLCAVGYSPKGNITFEANFDFGDGRAWTFEHMRPSATTVFEFHEKNAWEGSLFPAMFQTDNYEGVRVDISNDGTRVIQSSEHDNDNHMSNLICADSSDSGSKVFSSTMDQFVLFPNNQCLNQTSDVQMSDDGNFVVIVVQCLQQNDSGRFKILFDIHTYVVQDNLNSIWEPIGEPIVQEYLDFETIRPFSIAMSGDTSTLILTVGNGYIEFYERQDFSTTISSSAWIRTGQVYAGQVAGNAFVEHNMSDTSTIEYSMDLSKDGERLAVSITASKAPKNSVFRVYKKKDYF